jgi:hypothetical protein
MSHRRPALNPMFAPEAVAVVGATERPGSVSPALLENLKSYHGLVYPVNLKRHRVLGVPRLSENWSHPRSRRNDGAMQAADGYYRILGRVDDVINVAGYRLGTKELESAGLTVDEVAEAAVVPVVDEVRGRVPEIYIALKPGLAPSKPIEDKVVRVIETVIGKIARPKGVRIVPDMPMTRSGKITRRVLASISYTMDIGDVTTLANPEIVEQIRGMVQGEGGNQGRPRRHQEFRPRMTVAAPRNWRRSSCNVTGDSWLIASLNPGLGLRSRLAKVRCFGMFL